MDASSLPPSHSIHQMVFAAAAAARRSESCVDNYLHATRNIPSVRREHLVEMRCGITPKSRENELGPSRNRGVVGVGAFRIFSE